LSTLTSMVVAFAVIFWLSITTGSAEVLAFATIAALLPQLVLGLFTGVYIDRWDRKRTIIMADIFIAVCTAIIGVLFYLGDVKVTYVYALLALRSVGSAFHIPAMQASIPLLAPQEKLMRIAGINNMIQSVSNIAGPFLAALFISLFNMTYVLLLDVAGALAACISLLLVKIPNPEKCGISSPNMVKEISAGLKEIYQKPGILWLFIMAIVSTFFIMPIAALFPLMTLHHFSGNTYHMSIVEISWGIGMLIGGGILGLRKLKIHKVILINLMYLLLGLTFVFSGILPASGFIFFVVITAFGGISMSVYSGAFTVVLQNQIDPSALGRVFSTYGSLTLLPSMIGLLATGFIADGIGITNAFIVSGAAIAIMGVMAFFVPPVMNMVREQVSAGTERDLSE
jgi:DHA3 family macrolide efflux protein-like MFS transporter